MEIQNQSENLFYVTARTQSDEWSGLRPIDAWEIFGDRLFLAKRAFNLRIFSFVLLRDHYHALISAPEKNLNAAMCWFMRETGKDICRATSRINQSFGAPHKKTLIETTHDFHNAYKFVYRTPIEEGFSGRVEDYSFSTLTGLLGRNRMIIPVEEDQILFADVEETLRWINQAVDERRLLDFRKALRRQRFKLPIESRTGYRNRLESERL